MDPDHPSDDHLAYRAGRGDAEAADTLIRRHRDRVYRLCRGVLLDRAAAEDATQETFIRALRAVHRYRPDPSLTAWLVRIAMNTCRNHLRSRNRRPEMPFPETFEAVSTAPGPVAWYERREARRAVWSLLQQLDPLTRQVVVLRELEGWSSKEVGEVVGLSAGAVDTRIYRARDQLRKLAPRHDYDETLDER